MSIGIGLGTGITNFPSASGPEPTYDELIAKMMSGVDKGVWFDATDTSTMFQDISGLTPVTTVEQSIGLWLDKSKGLTFGGQFVINSDFSQGDTNWTLGTGWAIADGKATKTPGVVGTLTSTHAIVSTTWYQAKITITGRTAGSITLKTSANTSTAMSANGTYMPYFYGGTSFYIEADATFDGSITLFEARVSNGNHVITPVASASYRPKYSRRYNTLASTRTWSTANWTRNQCTLLTGIADPYGGTTAATIKPNNGLAGNIYHNDALLFDGVEQQNTSNFYQFINIATGATGKTQTYGWDSVTSTPIGSTGWYQIVVRSNNMIVRIKAKPESWSCIILGFDYTRLNIYSSNNINDWTYGNGVLTSISVCEPEVLLGQRNCVDVPYQWVDTSTSYNTDPEKFLPFVTAQNDTMQLPFVPTGISTFNKVTTAGAVSRMGQGTQTIIEHSASIASNNGSWLLTHANSSGYYSLSSKGTTTREAAVVPTFGRDGVIMIGQAHIAGDLVTMETNRQAKVTTSTDQGSGNYGNYQFYLFSRGGTYSTNPMKGRCYGIIVIYGDFSLADTDLIKNYFTEKMGVYLSVA